MTPTTHQPGEQPLPVSADPMGSNVPWDDYPMLASDDPAKRDLELVHTPCGEHLCDVQHRDILPVLAGVVTDHEAVCPQGRASR